MYITHGFNPFTRNERKASCLGDRPATAEPGPSRLGPGSPCQGFYCETTDQIQLPVFFSRLRIGIKIIIY